MIRARFAREADFRNQEPAQHEENVERKANEWAAVFGAGGPDRRFTSQPAAERFACERAGYLFR